MNTSFTIYTLKCRCYMHNCDVVTMDDVPMSSIHDVNEIVFVSL